MYTKNKKKSVIMLHSMKLQHTSKQIKLQQKSGLQKQEHLRIYLQKKVTLWKLASHSSKLIPTEKHLQDNQNNNNNNNNNLNKNKHLRQLQQPSSPKLKKWKLLNQLLKRKLLSHLHQKYTKEQREEYIYVRKENMSRMR